MSIRSTYLLGFTLVILLFLVSLYLQYFDGFTPCPLCALQRFAFGILGVLFLMGVLIHKKRWGRITVGLLSIVFAASGIALAIRQIWLQQFPPANHECGVSLQYMLEVLPLNQVLQKIFFEGTTECTERGWEFLHLNMAEWSLAWFIVFLLMAIYLFVKGSKRNNRW